MAIIHAQNPYLNNTKTRYNWRLGLFLGKLSNDVESQFSKPVYKKSDFVKIKNMECVNCAYEDKFEKFHEVEYGQLIKFHESERLKEFKDVLPKTIEDVNMHYIPVKVLNVEKNSIKEIEKLDGNKKEPEIGVLY